MINLKYMNLNFNYILYIYIYTNYFLLLYKEYIFKYDIY